MSRPRYKLGTGAIGQIRQRYLKGESVMSLAVEFGVTPTSIYRVIGDLTAQRRDAVAAFLSRQPISSTAPQA